MFLLRLMLLLVVLLPLILLLMFLLRLMLLLVLLLPLMVMMVPLFCRLFYKDEKTRVGYFTEAGYKKQALACFCQKQT